MKDTIREEFEQAFPLPNGVTFDGDHYVADSAVMGAFGNATIWSHMFRGWKAKARKAHLAEQADRDEREVEAGDHIVDRLDALLPELEYSRETHVQWRDCPQHFRDRNPEIGDSDFHARAVADYDERIAAIKAASRELRARTNGKASRG